MFKGVWLLTLLSIAGAAFGQPEKSNTATLSDYSYYIVGGVAIFCLLFLCAMIVLGTLAVVAVVAFLIGCVFIAAIVSALLLFGISMANAVPLAVVGSIVWFAGKILEEFAVDIAKQSALYRSLQLRVIGGLRIGHHHVE